MSDLIDRQAAIEVIDAVFPVDPMKSEYAQGVACGAALSKTYVEQLPSEQPDSSFITWLLDEIWDEDMWELNWQAFPEILCRKMAKLGYIRERNGEYERLDQQTGGN